MPLSKIVSIIGITLCIGGCANEAPNADYEAQNLDFSKETLKKETTGKNGTDSLPTPPVPDGPAFSDSSKESVTPEMLAIPNKVSVQSDTTSSTPIPGETVSIASLSIAADNLEQSLHPYLIDKSTRISRETAKKVRVQTEQFYLNIEKIPTLDKAVKQELRDKSIDIGSAVDEMSELSGGERYEQLRSILNNQIEGIQAELLNANSKE